MEKKSNQYALIMCGGSGPRLWPLSRANFPKQFLHLFGQNSLVKDTFIRFQNTIRLENIFFVTQRKYLEELRNEIGNSIPPGNFILEPEKKNTAMAILNGTIHIKQLNPDAIICVTPADHSISKLKKFKNNLQKSFSIASKFNKIVTIGITPSNPNPGFGYIIHESKSSNFYPVSKFYEKPNIVDAEILIRKKALWNSGIYTFLPDALIHEFESYQKEFGSIIKLLESGSYKKAYSQVINISIDKAISEKSSNLAVIKADFNWSDIGEWNAIWKQLATTKQNLVTLNYQGNFESINSKNCLIYGNNKKLIGLVGVNNLAIIDTPDCLLVCDLRDSFSVRELVKKIVNNPKLKHYFLGKYDR